MLNNVDYYQQAEDLWDAFQHDGKTLRQVFCAGFRAAVKTADVGGTKLSATRVWEEMIGYGEFMDATAYDVWRMAWGAVTELCPDDAVLLAD